MSVPLSVLRRLRPGDRLPTMRFFPNYVLRDVIGWYLAVAMLAALAALSPWELGRKADPFAPVPAGIRPEWYFLAPFQTLKMLPAHLFGIEGELVGVIVMGLAAAAFVVVPFLDRRASRELPSPLFTALALAALAYLVVFTVLGYVLA